MAAAVRRAAGVLDIGRALDVTNRHAHVADIVLTAELTGFTHAELALLSAIVSVPGTGTPMSGCSRPSAVLVPTSSSGRRSSWHCRTDRSSLSAQAANHRALKRRSRRHALDPGASFLARGRPRKAIRTSVWTRVDRQALSPATDITGVSAGVVGLGQVGYLTTAAFAVLNVVLTMCVDRSGAAELPGNIGSGAVARSITSVSTNSLGR